MNISCHRSSNKYLLTDLNHNNNKNIQNNEGSEIKTIFGFDIGNPPYKHQANNAIGVERRYYH